MSINTPQEREEEEQLGRPPLRVWELNSNSTRYERLVAAPSDDDLILMWTLWSILASVVAVFVSIEFLAILTSKKDVRQNPFNVYLLYLMIPDLVFAFACAVTCAINAAMGGYFSSGMCQFQSFYVVWCITANSWVNATIARQLHSMLKSSYIRRRYNVPTVRDVTYEAGVCYLLAAFVASWIFFGGPHQTATISGSACVPVQYDLASSIFLYSVFVPFMTVIPLLYSLWVCYDIYNKKLMPSMGRRRLLSIYFVRIIAVFVTMWFPFVVIVYVAGYWTSPWVLWLGGAIGHLQAAAGAAMSLLKPDVAKAFTDFVACRCNCCSDDGSASPPIDRMRSTIPEQNDQYEYEDEQEVAQEFSLEEGKSKTSSNDNCVENPPSNDNCVVNPPPESVLPRDATEESRIASKNGPEESDTNTNKSDNNVYDELHTVNTVEEAQDALHK